MEFLGAFLVCGFLCLMVQLASELLPQVPGPTLFLAVQAVGALLVPTGMIAALTACGETGIVVTVLAAGSTVCTDVTSLLAGGSVEPLVTIMIVFCLVAAIGLVSGAAYRALHRLDGGDERSAEGEMPAVAAAAPAGAASPAAR